MAVTSSSATVVIEPNRYGCRLALEPSRRQVDEHDAAGHAAVEEDGQRDVAAGLAAGSGSAPCRPRRRSATAVAIQTGLVWSRKPRATPVIATCPMPSPIRACRRCTR